MLRLLPWRELAGATIAAALLLVASPAPIAAQQRQPAAPQAQQAPPQGERVQPVELTQALIERWMVLFADLTPKLANADQLNEQQVDAVVTQACQRAQLNDVNQCRALDAYMSALLSGADEQTKRFVDPVQRARQDLQASQTDQRLSAQEKAEAKTELEGLLAQLPQRVNPAHIQLLNRNATRLFELLARYQPADQQGQGQQGQGQQGQGGQRGAPPPPQGQGGQPPRR